MNKNIKAISCIALSSLLQSVALLMFVRPANILPSGFTGLATLINLLLDMANIDVSVSILLLMLNVPVALFCVKTISLRFVSLSLLQISLVSAMLYIPIEPVFDDVILNTFFGGLAYGYAVVLALKVDASTGGTDFISLYISNKLGKGIWGYVSVFNICQFIIFGLLNDFTAAGYSIIMNLIITKTISSLYYRYSQTTMQITTSMPDELTEAYTQRYRHGISITAAKGGYSHKEMHILHTVVSNTEVHDIVMLLKGIDENVIINTFKTEKFYGGFYRPPIS